MSLSISKDCLIGFILVDLTGGGSLASQCLSFPFSFPCTEGAGDSRHPAGRPERKEDTKTATGDYLRRFFSLRMLMRCLRLIVLAFRAFSS